MRIALVGLAVLTTVLPATVDVAEAQSRPPRPWCLTAGRGGLGGGLPVCTFYTLEQCLGSVGGGTDSCYPNPAIAWDRIEGKRYAQPPRNRARERGY